MSVFDVPELEKLDAQKMWQETLKVVNAIYEILEDLPEEEKWETTHKLRHASNELLFTMSQALGDASPAATEYAWGNVRKFTTGLRAMYQFAGKQHFIQLDPTIMVQLDRLLESIDARVIGAYEKSKQANSEELEFWHKKYSMWKDMTHENKS